MLDAYFRRKAWEASLVRAPASTSRREMRGRHELIPADQFLAQMGVTF